MSLEPALTLSERIVLHRRREGLAQDRYARRLSVSAAVLGRIERGAEELVPSAVRLRPPSLGRLRTHEVCFIQRRRLGLTQETVAKGLKISRFWVNRMERGLAPCDDLVWYYNA